MLTEQLEKGREELTYLESVVQELSQAESEQDFNDIRAELESGGYLKENNVDLFAERSEFDGEHGVTAYNRTLQRPGLSLIHISHAY